MEEYKYIKLEIEDECIATLTINRPEAMNALSRRVLNEMLAVCRELEQQPNIRALIIQGAGDRAFIAGADIQEMRQMSPEEAYDFSQLGQLVLNTLEALPQLTIARVQGFALGGGCELAMSCDLVIAAKEAKFGQPEVNLGLIAGFGGTQRLVRRVGLPVALDVLCAGRTLSGDEAYQLGLASRVCALDELDSEINKTIKRLQKTSPAAVRMTKKIARQALDVPLANGLAAEATAFGLIRQHHDATEGMAAFLEKRSASFQA